MKTLESLGRFFAFQGSFGRYQTLTAVCLIEVLRVLMIWGFASFLPAPSHMMILLTYLPLMALVLYLYGTTVAARLRRLGLNVSLAYFWVLGIWAVRYILLPEAQTGHDMFETIRIGFAFVLLMLPLFAKDKKTLLFWK